MNHPSRFEDLFLSRRELLQRCGTGLGAMALATMLAEEGALAAPATPADRSLNPLAPRAPHFPGKVKRVIHLFMNGGPSQVDTFDPKPMLAKYQGESLPQSYKTERKTGSALKSPFEFKRYGRSGIEVSEIFAKTAAHIDDICVIRSMHADVPNHEPSLMLLNCGDSRRVRPSMGSWVLYGLGTENQNLPGFVVMCPGGYPIKETNNWRSAFLPGVYQGTYINSAYTRIEKLIEHIKNRTISQGRQRQQLDLVQKLNAKHRQRSGADRQLDARIQSLELAYRMQLEATDAFDVTKEPQHIRDMYGPGTQARQILTARRLLERGVRYVQLWHGAGQPWDNHVDIARNHRRLAGQCDQAIAALIKDLKDRGMFDDTLIIWGGEFGRTPVVELQKQANGRDHNHWGYTTWLAGGGVKGGYVHGSTDECGIRAEKDPVHVHDLQATILHLLGFDHTKLTYRYSGRDFRLTDVHGEVVKALLT